MTVGRYKFVVWTQNESNKIFELLEVFYNKYGCTYMHCGLEYTPTTNREHVDGYYEYNTQRKVVTEIKKFEKTFGKGFGDLQIARGSSGENEDYSEKEGHRFEKWGVKALGQGARHDILSAKEAILRGDLTVDTIAVTDPTLFHQYARTLSKIEDIALRKKFRTEMTTGIWYHGPTAVGKSHRAFEGYTPDTHYVWKDDKGWQDGYVGQPIVIINDFRGAIPYNDLLQMIDKWPYFVSRRGREPAPFLATKVIITSSLSPSKVYNKRDVEDDLAQLYRRIDVFHLKTNLTLMSGSSITPDHFEGRKPWEF